MRRTYTNRMEQKMNIQTVLKNLDNTIEGKRLMLNGINDTTYGKIMKQYIEINIDELTKIRADVAECIPK